MLHGCAGSAGSQQSPSCWVYTWCRHVGEHNPQYRDGLRPSDSRVCRGETLYRIAARYGVSVQAIVAANGIWNPNAIYAGQRLVIPGCGSWSPPPPPPPACYTCPPPPAGCSVHYTVHPGDTLTRIAYRYGTTISNLMRCNAIANPNRIYAGQSLCICGGIGPVFPPGPPGP